jgi:putative chitinase
MGRMGSKAMTDRKEFFAIIRDKVFHGVMRQRQVDGINAILEAWEKVTPNAEPRFVAYALATGYWETAGTMQPTEAYGHGSGGPDSDPVDPCEERYRGRGFVQFQGLQNYERAEVELRKLRVLEPEESLVTKPELALRLDVAAAILVYGMLDGWFTGRKLADFFHGDFSDWIDARTIINGCDSVSRSAQIAGDALQFFAALQAQSKTPTPEQHPEEPQALKDRKAFFDIVRAKVFHGLLNQRQVDGINSILDAWGKAVPNPDPRFVAYALATAHRETAGTMQPVRESFWSTEDWRKEHLRRYYPYYGRGFIQLTWKNNYEKANAKLHTLGILMPEENMLSNLDLALRPDVASAVMVFGMTEGWFTGFKLSEFFHGDCCDWIHARRIINGNDHDREIAGDALHFYAALQAQGNSAALKPANSAGIHKFYVIGDSIAHGVAAAMGWPGDYQDGRSYAFVAQCDIPHDIDALVVSTLTNPQPKTNNDWLALQPSLEELRKKVDSKTRIVWILPSQKFPQERKIVADCARKYGDGCVGFTPAPDHIHPASYRDLAHEVLAVLAQPNLAGVAAEESRKITGHNVTSARAS